MRSLQYFVQRLSLAFVIACLSMVNLSHASDNVLVLLRGTAVHPFNQELLRGIVEANEQAKTPFRFEIQYTGDRLSATYDSGWDSYHSALQALYNQQEWRAIVVTWPNDLHFALRKFAGTTVVNFSPRIYSGPEQVINLGQEFKQRITSSLRWLRDDYPHLNSLHLIVGSRRVEESAVKQIIEAARELGFAPPDLMTSRDPSELSRQVANLGDNEAVIYMPLLVDENGEMLIGREVLQQLAEVSAAPVLSPLQSFVAAGAIGGYVGDVGRYGSALVEVLQGDIPEDSSARSLKTSQWVFNQMQMERYGMELPSASDPRFQGALILNTPPPLFSERGWGVLMTLGFSAAILLLLLLIWSRREAKAHKTIAALNHSLKQKNLELTDTNQELEGALYEAAIQELKAATRTAQLQLAMRLASVTVFEIDYQTLRARRSGETEWRPLLQVVAGGLDDSQQIERILTLNQAPYTNVDVECWGPGRENNDHRHAYRLTLSERAENEEGQEVFYMVRQEISAVKDAQQRLEAEAHERRIYQLQVARMTEHLKRFQRENHTLTEIAKRADLDSLTGCLNRRAWERLAEQEFSRLKRQQNSTTSTLLMLDLDFFKQINDGHGHLAGDKVLKDFVAAVLRELRESDLLGRFGGEEFLVLLPDTGSEAASHFAERLRLVASQLPTDFGGGLTVSIGVAQHAPELESVQRWIELADGALYLAKAKGRNRVQVA